MAVRSFYTDDARSRVKELIAATEARSAVEIVVTLRSSSGHYRHTDLAFGFALAFASLLTFLFHPRPMRIDLYPVEHLAAFAIGALMSRLLSPLRRTLTSRRLMTRNVATAARAAFVDQGVDRTRGRTGVLIYLSVFEQKAEIVADAGVDLASRRDELEPIRLRLQRALRGDLELLLAELKALGDLLAELVPPEAHDIDELPNAMVA